MCVAVRDTNWSFVIYLQQYVSQNEWCAMRFYYASQKHQHRRPMRFFGKLFSIQDIFSSFISWLRVVSPRNVPGASNHIHPAATAAPSLTFSVKCTLFQACFSMAMRLSGISGSYMAYKDIWDTMHQVYFGCKHRERKRNILWLAQVPVDIKVKYREYVAVYGIF